MKIRQDEFGMATIGVALQQQTMMLLTAILAVVRVVPSA